MSDARAICGTEPQRLIDLPQHAHVESESPVVALIGQAPVVLRVAHRSESNLLQLGLRQHDALCRDSLRKGRQTRCRKRAEVGCLLELRVHVLRGDAEPDREMIVDLVGELRVDRDRRQIELDAVVAAHPVGVVFSAIAKRHEDAQSAVHAVIELMRPVELRHQHQVCRAIAAGAENRRALCIHRNNVVRFDMGIERDECGGHVVAFEQRDCSRIVKKH